MPLNLFYTMVQKSQKWPKTQIKGVLPPIHKSLIQPYPGQAFLELRRAGGGGGGAQSAPPLEKTLFPFSESTQVKFFWKLVQNWVLWSKLGFHGNHGYGFKVVHIFQIFDKESPFKNQKPCSP